MKYKLPSFLAPRRLPTASSARSSQSTTSASNRRDPALAKLCDVCAQIFNGKWAHRPTSGIATPNDDWSSDDDYERLGIFSKSCPRWGKVEGSRVTVQSHHTPAGLKAAAADGCQLCSMWYDQLCYPVHSSMDSEDWQRLENARGVVQVEPFHKSERNREKTDSPEGDLFIVSVDYYKDGEYDDLDAHRPSPGGITLHLAGPSAYSSIRKPFAKFEPLEHTVQSITDWVYTCINEHPGCKVLPSSQIAQGTLPTRLLHVGPRGTSSLRLRESRHISGHPAYVTLSHCWGGKLPFRLTSSNYQACLDRIQDDHLPLTFRHAVAFAQQLGIHYLWIDALCIIQDSRDDWSKESLQMADVYSNAYLTIAATASVDGHGGLFRERNHTLTRPCLVEASWDDGNTPARYCCVNRMTFYRRVLQSPINQRAWVFQERNLATRIVHFARDQIWWQCRDGVSCEAFPQGIVQVEYSEHTLGKLVAGTPGLTAEDGNRVWRALVSEYMFSKLTYDSDRLIALAGIATKVQDILGWKASDYLAGFWRHGLPRDLLWEVDTDRRRIRDPYVAPSWSWASVSGQVSFRYDGPDAIDHICVDVLDVQTTFDRSPYGPLRGGCLTLSGELHQVILSEPDLDMDPMITFGKMRLANGVELDYDFSDQLDDTQDYHDLDEKGCLTAWWCIVAHVPEKGFLVPEGRTKLVGLLLRAVRRDDGAQVYSRIGLISVTEKREEPLFCPPGGGMLEGGKRKVITIV